MEISPQNISDLKRIAGNSQNGPSESLRLLTNFNNELCSEEFNSTLIDTYFMYIFDETLGLHNFLSIVSVKPEFEQSIKKALEIYYTLLNTFPQKIGHDILVINDICLKIFKSIKLNQKTKSKALNIIVMSLEKIQLYDELEHYKNLYDTLKLHLKFGHKDSVLHELYTAIGMLSEKFPLIVSEDEKMIKQVFFTSLNQQMFKQQSQSVLSGLFTGFKHYCIGFPLNVNDKEDSMIIDKIYKHIKVLLKAPDNIKTANRAALLFFIENSCWFSRYLYTDHKEWHSKLLKWLKLGAEEQKVAFKAFIVLHKEIGNYLEGQDKDENMSKYFLDYFIKVLNNSSVSNYEKHIANKGSAAFAPAFHKHLTREVVENFVDSLINCFDKYYMSDEEKYDENIEYLPDYIETVATFFNLRQIDSDDLTYLQKATILLIRNYPKISKSNSSTIDSLMNVLILLRTKKIDKFVDFMENFIYQGVLWSCSHHHISYVDQIEDKSENIFTIKNYLPFWKNMLDYSRNVKAEKDRQSLKYIHNQIIRALIKTLLILINKLNVETVKCADDYDDIEATYRLNQVDDYSIFLNIVDFYEVVLPIIEAHKFKQCLPKLLKHLILKSLTHPLISGFYKLISSVLIIVNQLDYFKSITEDVKTSLNSLEHFLAVILEKAVNFKDDLLIGCLQVLLNYPIIVIKNSLLEFIRIFKKVFEVGQNSLEIAKMGLNTLIHWQNTLELELIDEFLIEIIPCLDGYLRSKNFYAIVQNSGTTSKTRKNLPILQKRKIVTEIESELLQFQRNVINFIGRQNSTVCQAFIDPQKHMEGALPKKTSYLKIELPYNDLKTEVCLDRFVPRIVDLALHCSDIKIRTTACELLHGIVIVFLGSAKQMNVSRLSELDELLGFLAPAMLKLACDMQTVIQNLFESLFIQLIHWYTHPGQKKSQHANIIIESIMEGITNPSDSALRDFSGKCVRELIKWNIKQNSEQRLAQDPFLIKGFSNKIQFYSTHPDSNKKLGAALIFNNIYMELREESNLISIFWFEFLHNFILSLNLTHDEIVVAQIENALNHIERVLIHKREIFNKKDSKRRIPSNFQGGLLKDAVYWILIQTGSNNKFCRRKCMEMFINISKVMPGYHSTLTKFLDINNEDTFLKETYEDFLEKHPTFDSLSETVDILNWTENLCCSLEGNAFLLKYNLIDKKHIPSQNLLICLKYFLEHIYLNDLENLAVAERKNLNEFEKVDYMKLKSEIVLNLFKLLDLMIIYSVERIDVIVNSSCLNLFFNVLFYPEKLGFNITLQNIEYQLILVNILKTVQNQIYEENFREFLTKLDKFIENSFLTKFDLRSNISRDNRNLINGLLLLEKSNLIKWNSNKYTENIVDNFIQNFSTYKKGDTIIIGHLQETTLNYCCCLLKFAFTNLKQFEKFVDFLYISTKVKNEEFEDEVNFGLYILDTFEDILVEIVKRWDVFFKIILQKDAKKTTQYIGLIINFISKNKNLQNYNQNILNSISENWVSFESEFSLNPTEGVYFIKILLPSIRKHNYALNNFVEWLIKNLQLAGINRQLSFEIFSLLVELIPSDYQNMDLMSQLTVLYNLNQKNFNLEFCMKTCNLMANIKNSQIFEFILDCLLAVDLDLEECDLQKNVSAFVLNANTNLQEQTLNIIYRKKFQKFPNSNQYKIVSNLKPLFEKCEFTVYEDFMTKNIKNIINILEQNISPDNLVPKILQFILIEILFVRIDIKNDTSCNTITQASGKGQNKELLQECLKWSLLSCKETANLPEENREFIRLYKCQGYNTLASIVINSLKDSKFYDKLFVRYEGSNEVLWSNLLDLDKKYTFKKYIDNYSKERKIIINIRRDINREKIFKPKYMEFMKIFTSSLSEDVSKHDFTSSLIRENQQTIRTEQNAQSEISLEIDEINSHECMPTVCAVIQYIYEEHLKKETDPKVPSWILGVKDILLNDHIHENVKIFWIKVICNNSIIFENYGNNLLEPLLKFLVDKSEEELFNHFTIDIVQVLASWSNKHSLKTEAETHLATKFFGLVIAKLDNDRVDVFKYYLELLKLITEAWGKNLKISHELVASKLECKGKKVLVAIHILSILLANNVTFCTSEDLTSLLTRLLAILKNQEEKEIYKPCSETIGLLLAYKHDDEQFLTDAKNVINNFLDKSKDEKYANCLEKLAIHYPQIIDHRHIYKILSRLYSSSCKQVYVKIILKRLKILSDIDDFKSEEWQKYLGDSLDVKLPTLELIYKTIDVLKDSNNFPKIIENVCKNISSPNDLCRSKIYDIAIIVYSKNYSGLNFCENVLVEGFTDKDPDNKQKIFNFWQNYSKFPQTIVERFSFIFNNLYRANVEKDFLNYTTFLLLNSIRNKQEFNEILFQHPLEDCNFEDLQLQLNWRMQNRSLPTFFVQTLKSGTFDQLNESSLNQLRQTQEVLSFTPTQNREKELSQYTQSESSLVVDKVKETFVNPNYVKISQTYKLNQRRFFQEKSKINRHFAQRQIRMNIKDRVERADRAKEKENKVTIYRKYRKGDFPDVQIPLSSILIPLQALALNDEEISRILFSNLFVGVLEKKSENPKFHEEITNGINQIFENSQEYNTNFFRTIFDLLLKNNQIKYNPLVIAKISEASGLIAQGTLLVEDYLSVDTNYETESKKSRGFNQSGQDMVWVKLAGLYKKIDEWDVVKAIFLNKMKCKETIREALLAESEKQWKLAKLDYEDLIQTDLSLERKDFYYESWFQCFAHLGEWQNLPKAIASIVEDNNANVWNKLWDNDWNQDKLLPWYMDAQLKGVLLKTTSPAKFLEEINSCLADQRQSEFLKTNYTEHLAILNLVRGNIEACKRYLKIGTEKFLSEWCLLNPMFANVRYSKLMKLRNLIDVDYFIDIYQKLNLECEEQLEHLINYWHHSNLEHLPTILMNETRILYRREFVKMLLKRMELLDKEDFCDILTKLKQTEFNLLSEMLEISVNDQNFYMARNYYRQCINVSDLKLKFHEGNIKFLEANLQANPAKKIDALLKAAVIFSKDLSKSDLGLGLKLQSNLRLFEISVEITNYTMDHNLSDELKSQIASSLNCEFHDSTSTIVNNLNECVTTSLENLMETDDKQTNSKLLKTISKIYVTLAKYMNNRDTSSYILYVLKAMQLESSEARQMFPCILMEDNLWDLHQKVFIDASNNVPVWMFLDWIPQLLSNIDHQNIVVIEHLVLKIAQNYPQAIMYPYRLSKETYKYQNEEIKDIQKELIEKLDNLLLKDENVDKFLKALSAVSLPLSRLRYYNDKLIRACRCEDNDKFLKLKEIIIGMYKPGRQDRNLNGALFEKQVKEFETVYKKLKHANTQTITDLQSINEKLVLKARESHKSIALRDLCPWLATFSANKLNIDLEIPGQYSGKRLPLIQHHVKIAGFNPTVSVMLSLRRPIKLTILGNNTKQYPFLVKFGEDIRQDERIQQLLSLMNTIFVNDPSCNQRNFFIETYQVIPLTTSLGMIQWIEPTISLLEVITTSLNSEEQSQFNSIPGIFQQFITKSANKAANFIDYGKAAVLYSKIEVEANFQKLTNMIPLDVIRRTFWRLSFDVEHFVAFRMNFIRSYAILCTCHWILGIGDRHLNNSKLFTKTGNVLGIDFGHAFGTATQHLPTPELIPFRLTPHLVAIMEPLGVNGLFRETMVHCLRALRQNGAALLATMDVFIKEPSLDWLECAASSEENIEWYPLEKIDRARRKLSGINPTQIFVEELTAGHKSRREFMETYIKLVAGDNSNVRFLKHSEELNVEDQVDCLIDLAVDNNLLGRMFGGFMSWI